MSRGKPGRIALASRSAIVALVAVLTVAGPIAQAAPADRQFSQFFQETRFSVDNAAFRAYFQSRGGVQTFGYPVSREFTLQGFPVQIFQRGVLQQASDGSVRLLNLLDQGLMPVTSVNFAQLPGPDEALIAAIPPVSAPDYAPRIADFVRANVPDQFEGLPVNFQRTFVETAGSAGGEPGLMMLRSLEVWGAPTSRPVFDPNNRGFVYQRFQRGVMHFDAATGRTVGLLLGDSFKSVLTGQGLPVDLERQMQGSPYLRQYDNARPLGLARPEALPDSDLTNAFEPQEPPAQGPFQPTVEVVATNLTVPWALAFAPDGRLFFTERPGRIRVIAGGQLQPAPVAELNVASAAEAGLMGLALSPTFQQDGLLYVMYTYQAGPGRLLNRVSRLTVQGNQAGGEQVLLDGIPGSGIHDGGRLKFGPDGKLYVATGDATAPSQAQNGGSLAGKILRMNPDGGVPADNPFPGSLVFSLGHRNPQGLAWQPGTGRLYITEHGAVGNDEVNLVEPGRNYGWPIVQGQQSDPRFVGPITLYNPAIAPTGAVFYDAEPLAPWRGSLFFTTLRGQHLHRLVVGGDGREVVAEERLYDGVYGRLREVVQGPDGFLYFTTSNRDGRGSPGAQDDRILRIVPGGGASGAGAAPEEGRALRFPDLRTLPPENLSFGREVVAGVSHHVLRFANTIWNAGEGPLEVREVRTGEPELLQRIYEAGEGFVEIPSGALVYHEGHDHWHLDDFARYELWTRAEYDAWQASNRTQGQPGWRADKVSFCLLDTRRVNALPGSPTSVAYTPACRRTVQGISVGWGDVYTADLPGQWIDLGPNPLPDGQYVLRSVADPENHIRESAGGADPNREDEEANAAQVLFAVEAGRITAAP